MKLPDHGPNESVERTEKEREFFAITEDEIWAEARDRLNIASEFETDNRKRAKQCMLFREGDQWDHDIVTTASEDSPELTINLTDAYCTRVENNIKQQRPRGKCHPVGDGADIEVAELINGIGRHIEVRSDAGVAYDTAASCAITGNVGYFRLVAEYIHERSFQKDLRILPIRNPFTVSMDPSAIMPDGRDQAWCIISVKMKRTEYKMRFPNAPNAGWNDLTRDEPRLDWEDKEEIRLAEYFRIREKEEKLYLIRHQNGDEMTLFHSELPRAENGRVVLAEAEQRLLARGLSIQGSRDSIKHQVEWFRLNGLTIVDRAQLPGTGIPVFRVEGNARDIDGRVRRRGMIDFMMDPQRMVNYGEVAKIMRLGLAPKAPWVGAEGQFDGHPEWKDANQKPYSVLTYKPVSVEGAMGPVFLPPPQRQPPAQIEAGFSEFVGGMRSNLGAVAGMPNEPSQDMRGEVVSGNAIKRRQWLSDQSHYQYYDNLTLAIAQCWRTMVEWIPHYYSESRLQRIIREDSTPEMVHINKRTGENGAISKVENDLSVGRYDVVMDTGPGYETKREDGAEALLQLLGVGPLAEIIAKTGADLVFRAIDHPYMQELADRLMAANPEGLQKIMDGLSDRAKSVVQSLANENQALKQKLQQMELDMKGGITKAHLAATVKAHDTETRARTQLAVEEIRAGGKLLDSRAEHGHERDMLERQLTQDAITAAQNAANTGEPQ